MKGSTTLHSIDELKATMDSEARQRCEAQAATIKELHEVIARLKARYTELWELLPQHIKEQYAKQPF
jgi:hypothetical protein